MDPSAIQILGAFVNDDSARRTSPDIHDSTKAGACRLGAVCVYAGSTNGNDPRFSETAAELGTLIAERGQTLVYGGARRGLMGTLADAALAAGGYVVGVIPEFLFSGEVGHRGVSELCVVDSMHARKQCMADRSDAFLALPGGLGTLEELVEVWTWTHLGLQNKPCGLLDINGYYSKLRGFFNDALASGLLRQDSLDLLYVSNDAGELLDTLDKAPAPTHSRLARPPADRRT